MFTSPKSLSRPARNESSEDVASTSTILKRPLQEGRHIGSSGMARKFFKRPIDVAEYRNAKEDLNPANNRPFGGFFHNGLVLPFIATAHACFIHHDSRLLS